jgi:hypothetical protein
MTLFFALEREKKEKCLKKQTIFRVFTKRLTSEHFKHCGIASSHIIDHL